MACSLMACFWLWWHVLWWHASGCAALEALRYHNEYLHVCDVACCSRNNLKLLWLCSPCNTELAKHVFPWFLMPVHHVLSSIIIVYHNEYLHVCDVACCSRNNLECFWLCSPWSIALEKHVFPCFYLKLLWLCSPCGMELVKHMFPWLTFFRE
jgi:hypothetical protein